MAERPRRGARGRPAPRHSLAAEAMPYSSGCARELRAACTASDHLIAGPPCNMASQGRHRGTKSTNGVICGRELLSRRLARRSARRGRRHCDIFSCSYVDGHPYGRHRRIVVVMNRPVRLSGVLHGQGAKTPYFLLGLQGSLHQARPPVGPGVQSYLERAVCMARGTREDHLRTWQKRAGVGALPR